MRILFEMDKKDYSGCTHTFTRNSARSIIIRNGKVAMVHSLKYDYYKFPGGGIEGEENPIDAMIRETREEAGLRVVPETVKEYGIVHRIQKSDKDETECFVQDNYYYLCKAEDEPVAQDLDEYEAKESYRLEFVNPETAIKKNRNVQESPYNKLMFEREARVLELLQAEGYLKTKKYDYSEMPESLKGNYAEVSRDWGFCWKECGMTVPAPMFLVTTYKGNGLTNACMQSWSTFTSANHGKGYYAILGSVNKGGHLYSTLKEKREAVINFFSSDYYDACMATIRHNEVEADEISAAGLTAEPASWVNAPMVRECFMNLECRYVWEKEIVPGDDHVMICLEVIGAHIDETYLADKTGEKGLLYNIHYQLNPERIEKTNHDYAGVIVKKIDMGEY